MGGRGDYGEILLYKTAQGAMLRSSLNKNFTDLKEMEFNIRKQAPEANHNSTQTILKDHYARSLLTSANRSAYSNMAIPLIHRRSISKDDPQKKYARPRSHRETPRSSIPTLNPFEQSRTPRASNSSPFFQSFPIHSPSDLTVLSHSPASPSTTRKSLLKERSDGIAGLDDHIAYTRCRLRMEKKEVRENKAAVITDMEECIVTLQNALKVDKRGYIPKALREYKEKRAKERADRGESLKKPQAIHLKKDVIREYRADLLKKALMHGIDKELRYVYTFGTISTTNT